MTEATVYAVAVAVALVSQIVLQIMAKVDAMRMEREQKARAQITAAKVDEVKEKLSHTNNVTEIAMSKLTTVAETTQRTGEKIHMLVNSAMTAALKVAAVALRRVADLTKTPEDIAAAKLAESSLKTHERTQEKVNSME